MDLCASNLIADPKSNEKCEYKDYLLDKTAENTLVLSENDDVHIYGEERISTENADGIQTYLSGNNQSVMAEISSKGTMSQIEYDDFGKQMIKQAAMVMMEKSLIQQEISI